MSALERYPVATAAELLGALRARKVSSAELVEAAIARIEAFDSQINAVIARDFDIARSEAKAADARLAKGEGGPLTGLPMTVKESFDLRGHMTTWGVADFKDYRAGSNALAVQRLKDAGAVILGKTNVATMLADWQSWNQVYGRTNNPYGHSRSAGGSSGGSAAALAAGYAPLELGTDIGGSIRIPAAFNGVFGHKSSQGLVPTLGHAAGGMVFAPPPLGVAGPLARSAADLRLALEVVAGPAPDDAAGYSLRLCEPRHADLSGYRVLILTEHPCAGTDSEVVEAIEALALRIEKAGAKVGRDRSVLPDLVAAHRNYLNILLTVTTRRGSDGGGREPLTAHQWLDELDKQLLFRRRWADVFREWDVVVAPAFGTAAFPHTDEPDWKKRSILIDGRETRYNDQLAWAGIANLPNLPSTAFPLGLNREGLPIGAQAIGPYLEDLTPIAFAGLAAADFIPPKL